MEYLPNRYDYLRGQKILIGWNKVKNTYEEKSVNESAHENAHENETKPVITNDERG